MHGDEKACLEALNELTGTQGVAVSYTAIDREHDQVKAAGYLADILEFTQELLLLGNGVD